MKKKKTINKRPSNRIPPSVPKCVRRCSDGYATDFIQLDNNTSAKFLFKKTSFGYEVNRMTSTSAIYVNMSTDNTLSPTTRHLFTGLTTLKTAIEAVEKWLGHTLPHVR